MSGFKFKNMDFDDIFATGSTTTSTRYTNSSTGTATDIKTRYKSLTDSTNYSLGAYNVSYMDDGVNLGSIFSPYYQDYDAGSQVAVYFGIYNQVRCILIAGGGGGDYYHGYPGGGGGFLFVKFNKGDDPNFYLTVGGGGAGNGDYDVNNTSNGGGNTTLVYYPYYIGGNRYECITTGGGGIGDIGGAAAVGTANVYAYLPYSNTITSNEYITAEGFSGTTDGLYGNATFSGFHYTNANGSYNYLIDGTGQDKGNGGTSNGGLGGKAGFARVYFYNI